MYISDVAERFSDTSAMGYESMYVYTVNGHDGIMLQHPDEDRIGKSVENAAVKHVLELIEKGEQVDSACV